MSLWRASRQPSLQPIGLVVIEAKDAIHVAVYDTTLRVLAVVQVPSRLEPSGLYCSDGKHLDGITVV